jgi:hypothetical protein
MSLQLRFYLYFAWVAATAAIIGGLLALAALWLTRPGPPMHIIGAEAVNAQVQAGDMVAIRFEITRTRSCPAVIYGFLVDDRGSAVVRYEPELGGYGRVGSASVVVNRPVPAYASGRLCYRHTRIDSCETRSYVVAGPDVCFDVIAVKG